jgi:hypothetical protein
MIFMVFLHCGIVAILKLPPVRNEQGPTLRHGGRGQDLGSFVRENPLLCIALAELSVSIPGVRLWTGISEGGQG